MDLSTIIGMVAGLGIIVMSILDGSSIGTFINAPGLMVVAGGTLCATMMSETMGNTFGAVKVAMKAFFNKGPQIEQTIKTISELAVVVRKEGLLALENQNIEDPFLGKGVRLAVDGIPPEEIQATLRSELIAMKARHKRAQTIFRFVAATAPAMGMIGTLIGLVQMLQALDDPSSIGPAMAVALLTTFYGAFIAFMLAGPVASKLENRTAEEAANMGLVVEGLDSIMKGENARIVQEKLEGHLAPKDRTPPDAK